MSESLALQRDTLDAIVELGRKTAEGLEEFPRPDGSFVVRQRTTGEIVDEWQRINVRSHALETVREVPEVVAYLKTVPGELQPVVWYDCNSVKIVVSDQTFANHGIIRCPLTSTAEYSALERASETDMDQKQLLTTIRRYLFEALGEKAEPFTAMLKELVFQDSRTGSSGIDAGKSNYSEAVNQQVESQAGDFKAFERLTLAIRIHDDPALTTRRDIRCILEDNPQDRTFRIVPLANQITDALDAEMEHLRAILSASDCPVFYGSP